MDDVEKEVLKVKDALNTLITPGNGIQVALDYLIGSANELKGELSAIKGHVRICNPNTQSGSQTGSNISICIHLSGDSPL